MYQNFRYTLHRAEGLLSFFRLCLILLGICTLQYRAEAQVIQVCNSCDISDLSEAITKAQPHDTLMISGGVYRESDLVLNKPLTVIGNDKPVIDGGHKGEIITITADSVTLKGLYLKNVGKSYTSDHAAVRVKNSSYYWLEDLEMDSVFFGIYLEKSNIGTVVNNRISGNAVAEHNSGNGIQLWYSHNVTITNNTVSGVRDGIYLEFANNCQISGNISKDNLRYGLHFMFSNDDTYQNNTFENNGAGVAVMFSKNIDMIGNKFRFNWGTASYGLLLKEINDAHIEGNTFEKNSIAINIEGSNRIDYHKNDFIQNGWAVKVRGACYQNRFTENNFLYNSFDVAYNSKLNDNEFTGNYWSSYTGYDLDKDGVGDVPYRPVKLFSYIVNRTPETLILMRSLFVDLIDFSERVSPVFTPDNLTDPTPKMRKL